jgi:tetratricopeptide (TPR) repeat protein
MKNNILDEDSADFLSEAEKLFRQNYLLKALNMGRERLESFPTDAAAYIVICKALIGVGRFDDVQEILREVGKIISGLTLVYERVGDAYREKGFHQDAAVCYEKVISLHPDAQKAREVIEKMALLKQEDNPADDVYIINKEDVPEPEFFTITLAQLYVKQGHLQEAKIILEEVIKKEPQNAQALSMLGELEASMISEKTSKEKVIKSDHLIKTLSLWLENIERLKINAVEK